jgi:ABC-2 type transport system ATP-binding protein
LSQSAADFVSYAAELAGIPQREARQRASDILTMVGLHEERFRYLGDFSTGMKQRTMLAQAIVHDPEIVFLDEPTAGLDPAGREEMLELIGRLGSFGINVLVSSHVLPDIERTCDWVVMLDGGQVLRNGPLTGLTETNVVEIELIEQLEDVVAELERDGGSVEVHGNVIVLRSEHKDPFLVARDALATTRAPLRRMEARSTSLEDIFLGETPPDE